MASNRLKLIMDKADVMLICTSRQLKRLRGTNIALKVESSAIQPVTSARLL